jgi:predicted amidophosphoribosyltransferase
MQVKTCPVCDSTTLMGSKYCPECGSRFIMEYCEVQGCENEAEWEGWYRAVDFTGNTTGLIQIRKVCQEHKSLLIGGK